jgi:hypothetical protein
VNKSVHTTLQNVDNWHLSLFEESYPHLRQGKIHPYTQGYFAANLLIPKQFLDYPQKSSAFIYYY